MLLLTHVAGSVGNEAPQPGNEAVMRIHEKTHTTFAAADADRTNLNAAIALLAMIEGKAL